MEQNETLIKEKLSSFYTSTAAEYHRSHYLEQIAYSPLQWRQRYVEMMIDRLSLPRGARIVDVGCGPGELIVSLLSRGFNVWGVDISQGMVDEAIGAVRAHGWREFSQVAVGDIERLDFDADTFDVVVAAGVIEYQRTDGPALRELNRVLKPGGHLIINVTNGLSHLNFIDGAYRWMKKRRRTRAMLDAAKRALGRGPLNDLPDRRTHVPRRFDNALARHGFTKVGQNYFHFSPLPTPLDQVFKGFSSRLGQRMEALSDTSLGVLGGGYQVLARKGSPFSPDLASNGARAR